MEVKSNEVKKNNIEDYSGFNDISLDVVQVFFPQDAFNELKKYGITTLGELFLKEENREIVERLSKERPQAYELWRSIFGTINILKCKYLNKDPEIDDGCEELELANKLGLVRRDIRKMRHDDNFRIPALLKMVEKKDFTVIYKRFSLEKANEIINKIKVVYEYRQNNKHEVSLDEIHSLYEELVRLVNEHQKIGEQIAFLQNEINKKITLHEKGSSLK